MIASLPMYDFEEPRAATNAWWNGIASHLGVSMMLDRNQDYTAVWRASDLLFSQTCGYPFTHDFKGYLAFIATPHYEVDGCEGPRYCSIVLAREKKPLEQFRDTVAAVNGPDSMSGMLALKLVFSQFAEQGRFFRESVRTGSHAQSIVAVQNGQADVCAIDAVSLAMMRRYRPHAVSGLAEIARSPLVPALPYVTASSRTANEVQWIRGAIADAFSDRELLDVRRSLFLSDFSILSTQEYEIIIKLEQQIEKAGGLKLL